MRGLILALMAFMLHLSYRLTHCIRTLSAYASPTFFGMGEMNTGDLVFFSGNPLLSYLLNSCFTHVGMIVMQQEKVYILHITPTTLVPMLCPVVHGMVLYYRAIKTPLITRKLFEILQKKQYRYDFNCWQNITFSFLKPYECLLPTLPWFDVHEEDSERVNCAALLKGLLEDCCGARFPTPCYPHHFLGSDRWDDMVKISVVDKKENNEQ